MGRDQIAIGNNRETPEWFLECVRYVNIIRLDPCTTRANPTRADYIRTIDCEPDGLETDWRHPGKRGLVFVNPPYGRGLMDGWARKICHEAGRGNEIIALVRGDTSTEWAHILFKECTFCCFPKRIRFKGATGSPNFHNLVFYFGPNLDVFRVAFGRVGPIVRGALTPKSWTSNVNTGAVDETGH